MIDLESLVAKAQDLDPLPASAARLCRLLGNASTTIDQIAEVIEYDQALAGRVLRVANSAAYGTRRLISKVREAVFRLGTGTVVSLVVGEGVQGRLNPPLQAYGLAAGELWRHAVATALAVETLAPRCMVEIPPEAHAAALLHDIGKLVLARFLDEDILRVLRAAQTQGHLDRIRAEQEVLQVHHGELGGLIAQHWELPEGIVKGITYHHTPEQEPLPICFLIYLANLVAHQAQGGPAADAEKQVPAGSAPWAAHAAALAALGVSASALPGVCLEVSQKLESVCQRYQ